MSEKPQLRTYQIADLAFYIANPKCANLSDPGTGKTPSVCVYAYWLWTEKKIRSAWVMPKSLLKKNRDELLRFTHFTPDDIVIIDGPREKRAKLMASDAKVFLMGFDRWSADWTTMIEMHPDLKALLVDEIHLGYGSMSAQRTKQMVQSARHMERFLAMTGTLINGRLDSAYPTIHVIEPRYYGSDKAFINYHAIKDDYGTIIGWQNHHKLAAILGRHAIRHSFEEVYGKEAKVIIREEVEMSEQQRKAYDQFEANAILELQDEFLSSGGVGGVHALRCRQIMQHPETFGIAHGEVNGKDQRLIIHLVDHYNAQKPLIIFAVFQPEQERIVELVNRVGLRPGLINGNVSAPQRARVDEAFRKGEIDVMVASPATAGIGFNWEHVDHIVFTSLDYMDSSFVQGYRRAIRGVREKPLRITVLEYKDSIDQRIFQIVERKSEDAHKVDPTREKLKLRA